MKAFLVNYNFTPTWLLTSGLDYLIHDRSDSKEYLKDFPQDRIVYEENLGQVDYPKLSFLADSYDTLPEVFLWGKTNLFKYISEEEYEKLKDNQMFTPLLTQNHPTYDDRLGAVNYYSGRMYHERIDLMRFPTMYVRSHREFLHAFSLPAPQYIPFAPGGNYILTKDTVHKYSRDYYARMRDILPYERDPGEAQFAERSYYLMWR